MLTQQRIGKNVVYAQRGILNTPRQVSFVIPVKLCFVCANTVDWSLIRLLSVVAKSENFDRST